MAGSTDPTADSIEPPISGGKPAEQEGGTGDKIARLDSRRARHRED